MNTHGRTSLFEFLGDMVVFRNLEPLDPCLPRLSDLRPEVGLPPDHIPRKAEPDYARVMAHLLRTARALSRPDVEIARLLYIGDTRLLDGTAFRNIKAQGRWPGWAFIASEKMDEPKKVELEGDLYLVNRWAAMVGFFAFLREQGFPLDAATAVVVDIDKTAIGARGRNDKVIDQARVAAARETAAATLGDAFREAVFREAYDTLNRPAYHPFTADNQDYLAYVCLTLGAGLYDLSALLADVESGRVACFSQFIEMIDECLGPRVHRGVAALHRQVYANVRRGDPTPFKAFRYREYEATVARMGQAQPGLAVDELLRREIVITQEVREAANLLRERGALLFGLSDKPDEASIPRPHLAARGHESVHRVETEAVGNAIGAQLKALA